MLLQQLYSETIRAQTFPWQSFKVVRMLNKKSVLVLTFGRAKIQKHLRAFFQDFHPRKWTFRFRNSKWLYQKFRKEPFRVPRQTRSIQNFCFRLFSFCARETVCGPKIMLFLRWYELGSLGLRGISPRLNTNSHKFWKCNSASSVRRSKDIVSVFSVESFQRRDSKALFPG